MALSNFGICGPDRVASKVRTKLSAYKVDKIFKRHKLSYPVNTTRSLLCADVSLDGLTVSAGTDLQGEDALILYW